MNSVMIERTQEYSVLVTDDTRSSSGSGLLYYSGGGLFFVFTCKHVIRDIGSDTLALYLLLPNDPKIDDYRECRVDVPKSRVVFPADEDKDFAVIPVEKDGDLPLRPTRYLVDEAMKNKTVLVHGYPGGWAEGEALLEALDYARGTILHNIPSMPRFSLRNEDSFLDHGDRKYELEGFSGAPVWASEEDVLSVTGILSAGARSTVYRSRVYAEKMEFIRSFMKNRFNVFMRTKLEGIPESDVAGDSALPYNGTVLERDDLTEKDEWIDKQTEIIRGYIDDLKYGRAIDTAKAAMADERFDKGSPKVQRHLMQHLLYCYEILMWDEDFSALEKEMDRRGLIDGHDYLRSITSAFGRKEYQKTLEFAWEWLGKPELDEEKRILADTFILLARVHEEGLTYEESVGTLLDEHDALKLSVANEEIESLIYQMIGYVLSDHFRRHTQAIRCLNMSYRVGFDKLVLETLGGVYYAHAIADATDADNIVKISAVDRQALYKARECFILLMDKADDIFWESTIKRMGLVVFDTFFFSADNYRTIRTYPYVKKYCKNLTERALHDVELKYAKVDCQKGEMDFSQYQSLAEQDKLLFSVWADLHAASMFFSDHPLPVLQMPIVENQLRNTIQHAESHLDKIERGEQLAVRNALVNLYGRGIFTYNWDVIDQIRRHVAEMEEFGEPEQMGAMENFVLECERPLEEVSPVFRKRFEDKRDLPNWYELRNLYLRHYRYEEVDSLYQELFEQYKDVAETDSEFVYRGYIDYVTLHRRDIKDALKCYLEAKETIKDPDIANYWELELMLYTNTFNEPDRFEEERLPFLERGLISEETYHKGAFVAYLLNLNAEKAAEHNIYPLQQMQQQNQMLTEETPRELIHFLAWRGWIRPTVVAPVNKFMLPQNQAWVKHLSSREDWHFEVKTIADRYKAPIHRTIAIDGWALALLAFDEKLERLDIFDKIYVSHVTISRLLEEVSRTAQYQIYQVLTWIERKDNVAIQSADFAHQIDIRGKVGYGEPESAVALGYEKGCPVILGAPELTKELVDNYKPMILRASDVDAFISLLAT